MANKKGKYASIATYNPSDSVRYEHISDTQVTVAGESYTIAELYARHTNRHDPMIGREVFFEDTEDFESIDLSKLKGMDLFERQELYERVTDKAKLALEKIENHRKELEAKETQKSDETKGEAKKEAPKAEKPVGGESEAPENT